MACHGGVIVQTMIRWLLIDPMATGERAWFSPENSSITEWRFGPNPYGNRTGRVGAGPLQRPRPPGGDVTPGQRSWWVAGGIQCGSTSSSGSSGRMARSMALHSVFETG